MFKSINSKALLFVFVSLVLGLMASPALAAPAPHLKVVVCHATGSESNPYVRIEVSVHSADDANGLNKPVSKFALLHV